MSDCDVLVRTSGAALYMSRTTPPKLVVENTCFKMSFDIAGLRVALVLPPRELVLCDEHQRVTLGFDEPEDAAKVMEWVNDVKSRHQ